MMLGVGQFQGPLQNISLLPQIQTSVVHWHQYYGNLIFSLNTTIPPSLQWLQA
ncbi:unnamed protein product [Rhodiola kirilowii]